MTSSLVGSEMCIRDRPSLADHSDQCSEPDDDDDDNDDDDDDEDDDDDAVSYTHLTLPTICSV
eukprot:2230650-Prorocentrum_lima.AAC.1